MIKATHADFERKISRIATRNPEGGRVALSLALFSFAVFTAVSFYQPFLLSLLLNSNTWVNDTHDDI